MDEQTSVLLFLSVAYVDVTVGVRCRFCNSIEVLDNCTSSVDCAPDEICFTDEIITDQLTIAFNAGCRPKDVCQGASSPPVGKRSMDLDHDKKTRSGELIACSRCCEDYVRKQDGQECNTKLCGIRPSVGVRCRVCNNIEVLDKCTSSVNCAPDEICYTDEIITDQLTIAFNAGCRAKDVCHGASSTPVGKRSMDLEYDKKIRSGELIACSRCCEDNVTKQVGHECNTNLCGIRPSGPLRCRRCVNAYSLDACTLTMDCYAHEDCYMDEIVTDSFQIVYNGGCRPKQVCSSSAAHNPVGKRRTGQSPLTALSAVTGKKRTGSQVVACSRCCDSNECNTGLCGIKGSSG